MPRSPLTAVPAARSSAPTLAVRRRLVLALLALFVLLSACSTVAWVSAQRSRPVIPVLADQGAIGLAQTVASDFLAGRRSAVPVAAGVESDFSKKTTEAAVDGQPVTPMRTSGLSHIGTTPSVLGEPGKERLELVEQTFVATVEGRLMEVHVPMLKTSNGWVLGAAPSLVPAVPGTGEELDLNYADLYKGGGDSSMLPTPQYAEAIAAWAAALAEDGAASKRLYTITGDDSARTYSGLGGWKVAETPQIGSVVKVTSPYPGFIARVALVLKAPGANGPTLETAYDVYIRSDRSQQQPPIVAWGPAGSYKTLNPFVNADQR